jgi:hypothetical protein
MIEQHCWRLNFVAELRKKPVKKRIFWPLVDYKVVAEAKAYEPPSPDFIEIGS